MMVIVDTPTLITGMSMGFMLDYYLETGDWRFLAVCAGLLISLVAINIWSASIKPPSRPDTFPPHEPQARHTLGN